MSTLIVILAVLVFGVVIGAGGMALFVLHNNGDAEWDD